MRTIACLLTALALGACSDTPELEVRTGEAMGTTYRIKAAKLPDNLPLDALCKQLDADLSTWRNDSWVARFNNMPAGTSMEMPESVRELMAISHKLNEQTDGRFDIALGSLIQCWGFGAWEKDLDGKPTGAAVVRARLSSGMHRLVVDGDTLRKTRHGVMLDFSAIAKGYAVDRMAAMLREAGCDDFLIEFGGDVLASGNAPGKDGWVVDGPALDAPRVLHNEAIATSGSEHHSRDGLSHVIDPRRGRPVAVGPPVFAVAATCAEADALATARMVEAASE